MSKHTLVRSAIFFLAAVITSSGWSVAEASQVNPAWQFQAPEVKASVGYNSNLYGVRQGALANQSSMVFGVEPTLTTTYRERLRLQYSARAETYTSAHSEDNIRHNLGLRLNGGEDAWRYSLQSTQTRVQGSGEALIYDSGRNAYGTVYPRERRNQWQNRSSYSVEWRPAETFVRSRGRLLYYDLDTRTDNTPGYQNYLNRYDLNGGFDVGRELEVIGGDLYFAVRHGYTHQGNQGPTESTRSNHYERYFVGWEGRLLEERLRGVIEAGFGTHRYNNGPADTRLTRPYYRIELSWQVDETNRLRLEASEWQWVSSNVTGQGPGNFGRGLSVRFMNYTIGWDSELDNGWQLRTHFHATGSNYDGRTINDWVYTVGGELNIPLGDDWKGQVSLQQNYGRDEKQNLARSNFSRTLGAISLSRALW